MDWNEMVDLLTLVAIRDNRTVDDTVVKTWFKDIGTLDFEQASDAVAAHFLEYPGTWLMAGHVYQRVKAARAALVERAGTHAQHHALHGSDHGDERAHRDALRKIAQRVGDDKCPPFKALEGGRQESRPPESAQQIRKQWLADMEAKKVADRKASDERQAAAAAEQQARQEATNATAVFLLLTDEAAVAAYESAKAELGPDATRDQIMIRAAQLADHTKVRPIEGPPPETRSAKRGCREGCSPAGHEKPCKDADEDSPIGRVVEEK